MSISRYNLAHAYFFTFVAYSYWEWAKHSESNENSQFRGSI